MSRMHREMHTLLKNNAEKQRLKDAVSSLESEKVKRHERHCYDMRRVRQDLRGFQQSSGYSCCGLKDSTPLPAMRPVALANSEARRRSQTTNNTIEDPTNNKQTSKVKKRSFSTSDLCLLHRHSIALPGTPEIVENSIQSELQERSVVKRTVLVQKTTPKLVEKEGETNSMAVNTKDDQYIRPQDRHKYDMLITERLKVLNRSLPADIVSKHNKELNSALSLNSRKTALKSLKELHNVRRRQSLHVNAEGLALNRKVSEFLENLKSE